MLRLFCLNRYLQKYRYQEPKLLSNSDVDVGTIVVIPCFNEVDILKTLNSLNRCKVLQNKVEVIVVINQSESISSEIKKQNRQTHKELIFWKESHDLNFRLFILFEENLPRKHAGVGLARKIGMDEAVNRFFLGQNKEGIIVCLDADCTVSENYFIEIENHFNQYPKAPGCSIKFKHPLEGNEFSKQNYEGIINYELFLRYYNLCLKYTGLPYSFHTVGSSMAVKTWAYEKQGGMNKRKAGEDFYFLHKIIALGNFTELNTCCVFPSARTSDRVPFGTGKAINDFLNQKNSEYLTYDFNVFFSVKNLIRELPVVYKSSTYVVKDKVLFKFLEKLNFQAKIEEIKANTTNFEAFKKRFFVFFDAFTMLKYVHYARDNFYTNQEIKTQVILLLKEYMSKDISTFSKLELLLILRNLEEKQCFEAI